MSGSDPPESVIQRDPLTPAEYEALRDAITAQARRRQQNDRPAFREVDFFCGAMAVFFALGWQDKIPASWIMAPMLGRAILNDDQEEQP